MANPIFCCLTFTFLGSSCVVGVIKTHNDAKFRVITEILAFMNYFLTVFLNIFLCWPVCVDVETFHSCGRRTLLLSDFSTSVETNLLIAPRKMPSRRRWPPDARSHFLVFFSTRRC